jgi:hypothetical protein
VAPNHNRARRTRAQQGPGKAPSRLENARTGACARRDRRHLLGIDGSVEQDLRRCWLSAHVRTAGLSALNGPGVEHAAETARLTEIAITINAKRDQVARRSRLSLTVSTLMTRLRSLGVVGRDAAIVHQGHFSSDNRADVAFVGGPGGTRAPSPALLGVGTG